MNLLTIIEMAFITGSWLFRYSLELQDAYCTSLRVRKVFRKVRGMLTVGGRLEVDTVRSVPRFCKLLDIETRCYKMKSPRASEKWSKRLECGKMLDGEVKRGGFRQDAKDSSVFCAFTYVEELEELEKVVVSRFRRSRSREDK